MAVVVEDGERPAVTARGAAKAERAAALVPGETKGGPVRVDIPIEEAATATGARCTGAAQTPVTPPVVVAEERTVRRAWPKVSVRVAVEEVKASGRGRGPRGPPAARADGRLDGAVPVPVGRVAGRRGPTVATEAVRRAAVPGAPRGAKGAARRTRAWALQAGVRRTCAARPPLPVEQGATGGQGQTVGEGVVGRPPTPRALPAGVGRRHQPAPHPAAVDAAPRREGGAPGHHGGTGRRAPLRVVVVGLRRRARVVAPDVGHGPKPHGPQTVPPPCEAALAQGVETARVATESLRRAVATPRPMPVPAPPPALPDEPLGAARAALQHVGPDDGGGAAPLAVVAAGARAVVPVPTGRSGQPAVLGTVPRRTRKAAGVGGGVCAVAATAEPVHGAAAPTPTANAAAPEARRQPVLLGRQRQAGATTPSLVPCPVPGVRAALVPLPRHDPPTRVVHVRQGQATVAGVARADGGALRATSRVVGRARPVPRPQPPSEALVTSVDATPEAVRAGGLLPLGEQVPTTTGPRGGAPSSAPRPPEAATRRLHAVRPKAVKQGGAARPVWRASDRPRRREGVRAPGAAPSVRQAAPSAAPSPRGVQTPTPPCLPMRVSGRQGARLLPDVPPSSGHTRVAVGVTSGQEDAGRAPTPSLLRRPP